jgi:ABC-type transporter Mla subunit MlaD
MANSFVRFQSTLLIGLFSAAVLTSGCGPKAVAASPKQAATAAETKPADPMEAERDQVREGATQLTQAVSSLNDAVGTLAALQKSSQDPDLKRALSAIATSLDDAGASIADFSAEPPDLATFKAQFAAQDKKRLDAIDAANDALHDLDDATDALDPFLPDPKATAPKPDSQAIQDLEQSMEDAQDALESAVKALGGKVEDDTTTDVPVS